MRSPAQTAPWRALLAAVIWRADPAEARGFLWTANLSSFEGNLRTAFDTTWACGHSQTQDRLPELVDALRPMWSAVPKNGHGRVEWRMLRHLAHRYFMQRSALMVRGFEPTRQVDHWDWGLPDILYKRVPPKLESLLQSGEATEFGFSVEDVASVIEVLEQLVHDSHGQLVGSIYLQRGVSVGEVLGWEEFRAVLEDYLVQWLMGSDISGIRALMRNHSLRPRTFPVWEDILGYVSGQIKALDLPGRRRPGGGLRAGYGFEDAEEVAGAFTTSFASFWESQCSLMKNALFELDPQRTGRVPIAKFYSAALTSEWQFSESEAYLRELGALDESSPWRGSQVIIPNYIQAAPNCIVTTQNYWVCCFNECQGLFGEIETAVGKPLATPQEILEVVGNITAQESLADDAGPRLSGALAVQLERIAHAHKGQVPIHGRLFAQWLHYVFPHQCPFPHKAGGAAAVSPLEFGERSLATHEEMMRHVSSINASTPGDLGAGAVLAAGDGAPGARLEDFQWMSQWSAEEELLADYSHQLGDRPGKVVRGVVGACLIALVALLSVVHIAGESSEPKPGMALSSFGVHDPLQEVRWSGPAAMERGVP